MSTIPLTERAILLRAEDDVAIAKKELTAGTVLEDGAARIEVRADIKPGHKVARHAVRRGAPVRRYGQVIGFATQDIEVGDHVHSHNLDIGELSEDRYQVGVDVTPVAFHPPEQMRHFDGYRREDGRVGTRNYVAIISGVNCSASVSQFVKDKFRDVTRDFPNVDGVIAITHKSGCGTKLFGEDHLALQRVLAGYAKHPNVAAYILIGLGCEVNQAAVMVERQRMAAPGHPERKPFLVNIQEAGGIRKTVERAAAEVAKLLPIANAARRTKQPVSAPPGASATSSCAWRRTGSRPIPSISSCATAPCACAASRAGRSRWASWRGPPMPTSSAYHRWRSRDWRRATRIRTRWPGRWTPRAACPRSWCSPTRRTAAWWRSIRRRAACGSWPTWSSTTAAASSIR